MSGIVIKSCYFLWIHIKEMIILFLSMIDCIFDVLDPKVIIEEDINQIKATWRLIIKKKQSRASIEEACKEIPFQQNRKQEIDFITRCSFYGDVVISKMNGRILEFPPYMPCMTPSYTNLNETCKYAVDLDNLLQVTCGTVPAANK